MIVYKIKKDRKLAVCLVHEKEREVCLSGGTPWSGSVVKEGLASCMERNARCVCRVERLGVGVRLKKGWPLE